MTVVAVPIGKGNWAEARFVYDGPQTGPLLVAVGDRFDAFGKTWRVRRVEP